MIDEQYMIQGQECIDNQRWDVFKNNQTDPTLNTLTKK